MYTPQLQLGGRLLKAGNRKSPLPACSQGLFLLFAILVASPQFVFGQFAGGEGDGHERQALNQASLDGAPSGTSALYRGGMGDGYSAEKQTFTPGGQSLTSLYQGGSGDGFDRIQTSFTLAGSSLASLYGGGNGDGFDAQLNSLTLGGGSLAVLYGGGAGDGFDRAQGSFIVDGVLVSDLYGGGDGDGFDGELTTTVLGGAMLAVLYGGGVGDGFDFHRYSATLAGSPLAQLYGGGEGDGSDVFQLTGGIIPLPLSLIAFKAFPKEKYVLLKWVTEDELDTDFFTIQKTKDGSSFRDVSTVEAAGFSEPGERLHYEARDDQPYRGTSFYRLGTTDFDGTISHSQLIEVNYASADAWDFTAYPNPNSGRHLNILPEGVKAGEPLTFTVFDAAGRQVLTRKFQAQTGVSERIDFQEGLRAGTYLLRVESADGRYAAKLLIVGGLRY